MHGAMSSNSSDCVEFFPNTEGPYSSLDLEQSKRELSSSLSEHVLSSSDQGVYVPELGRRICSLHQLIPDQHASLSNNVLFSINSYMTDHPIEVGSGPTHRRGRRQPSKKKGSPSYQEIIPEVRNVEASTSQPAQLARRGLSKARA